MSIAAGTGDPTRGTGGKRLRWALWVMLALLSVGDAGFAYRYLPSIAWRRPTSGP